MQRQEQKYEAQLKALREAAKIGVVDIDFGRFKCSEAPEQLRCYLRELGQVALGGHSLESNEER